MKHIDEALSEIKQRGYQLQSIEPDGIIHRFGPKLAQWYVAYENQNQNGVPYIVVTYGDWRTEEKLTFTTGKLELAPQDRSRIREQIDVSKVEAEKAREDLQTEIAIECEQKWESLAAEGDSPYFGRKQITGPLGARFDGQTICVPCRDIDGKIWSLQHINPDGSKYFSRSGKVRGHFHVIGDLEHSSTFYIGEGFATMASVHIAMRRTCIVAFNSGNLIHVAQTIKERYPDSQLVICGDDDRWTKKTDGTFHNIGRIKAKKAAKETKSLVVFPKFSDSTSKPTDFNDLYCLEGIEAVIEQLTLDVENPTQKEKPPSQATILIALCRTIDLFHSPDGDAYATFEVGNHKETWALKSKGFREWLSRQYYLNERAAPSSQAMQDALGVLSAKANFDGDEIPVFLRIAKHEGNIYLDLCNADWEVVEITSTGWNVISNSPVRFQRSKGMLPISSPEHVECATGVTELQSFLNVETKDDFMLLLAWLVSAYNPDGPYLVLVLYGEQGSAKSTTVKLLRSLIDPHACPLRREPRNSDDLMVSARSNWTVVIDNMSHLPDGLSDDFCRLATGGGLSKRQHYSNDEEIILNAKRPIILNGIDEFVTRGDLTSRSITISLPSIPEAERKREEIIRKEFSEAQQRFLGLVLNAISTSLANKDKFELEKVPRMADAWHFITAAETAFGWERGLSLKAFLANQEKANEVILNNSIVYPYIFALAGDGWEGTATELLDRMNIMRSATQCKDYKTWPTIPKSLSDRIRRINPALRSSGIEVIFDKTSGNDSKRMIHIKKLSNHCDASDASTQPNRNGDACVEHVEKKRETSEERFDI